MIRGSSKEFYSYHNTFPISYSVPPLEMSKSFDSSMAKLAKLIFASHCILSVQWDAKSIKAAQEHFSSDSPNYTVEILWGNLYDPQVSCSPSPANCVYYILHRNTISLGIFYHSALSCFLSSIFCSFTCLCVSESQRKKNMEKVRKITYVYHPFFRMYSKIIASEE